MKTPRPLRVLLWSSMAALASSAMATSIPFVTSGNNGPSGSRTDNWYFSVPATCDIACYLQVSVSVGGGAGVNITRDGGISVLKAGVGGYSGTFSTSKSATAQPAGFYHISQGFDGQPGTVNAYVSTM